jgi:hypothetical protein
MSGCRRLLGFAAATPTDHKKIRVMCIPLQTIVFLLIAMITRVLDYIMSISVMTVVVVSTTNQPMSPITMITNIARSKKAMLRSGGAGIAMSATHPNAGQLMWKEGFKLS